MMEMRALRLELNVWKPLGEKMEKTLTNLPQAEPVSTGCVTIVQTSSAAVLEGHPSPPTPQMPDSAHLESSLTGAASRSLDHYATAFGAVYTIALGHHQAKGAMPLTKLITPIAIGGNFTSVDHCAKIQTKPLHHPAMPDLPFPKLYGSNPKLWLNNCVSFFDVYEVDPSLWIRYSTMHLSGSAALWFQAVQSNIYNMSWEDFCAVVCAKFDRDEHNHLLR
jgi:hypothetical protein